MSIKKFIANKDNTITNAFKSGLSNRGTAANMGASDILEVFSIYAQATTSSLEASRILIDFPIDEIETARSSEEIPASGSVKFVLRLHNAKHSQTTPRSFSISVHPLSSNWSEGTGLDMEEYSDEGASNWISSSVGTAWASAGGDYLSNDLVKTVSFDTGLEDLEVDISDVVESWLATSSTRHGLLLKLSPAQEDGSAETSYYTKRFFARGSEFVLKRPAIEAQYDNSLQDDRGNLMKSSSLAPATENLNTIYFYNYVRGELKDIPSTGSGLLLSIATDASGSNTENIVSSLGSVSQTVSASRHSEGIYSATFAYSGSSTSIYDVWGITGSSGYSKVHTGPVMTVGTHTPGNSSGTSDYIVNITNLKPSYTEKDQVTLRVFTRKVNSTPNVYTVSTGKASVDNLQECYYKLTRVADNFEVIGYSTGSIPSYSKMSYDSKGSYFDLDMSILESNYLYEISILSKQGSQFVEQKEKFRFRVDP